MPKRRTQAIASAAFDDRDAVDRALRGLLESGIPRDLIEVAADAGTAKRFFRRGPSHRAYTLLAYAGRGALIGIILSMILSLVLVFTVDVRYAGPLSIVQTLGPNVGTLAGAVIGALWGLVRPRPTADYYCRVKQTGGILVIVHCKTQDQAARIVSRLGDLGGREPQVVPAT